MTNFRLVPPRILWGSSLQNAIDVGYPLDVATSWSAKRDGSIDVQAPSGVEESWTVGTDYLLKGDARWIPQSDVVGPPKQTGWDGSAGWRAFLEWARDKNQMLFLPESRNLVLYPFLNSDGNNDGVVDGFSSTPPAAGSATFSLDSAHANVQRIAISGSGNTSGSTTYAVLSQVEPGVAPGETLQFSCDVLVSGFANGVCWGFEVWGVDGSGNYVSGAASIYSNTSPPAYTGVSGLAGFQRYTTGQFTMPTGGVNAGVRLVLTIPANTGTLSAGTVWFTCAALRRNSTDLTCFDVPQIRSYLLDPRMTRSAISLEPAAAQEPDGTRRFTLLLRNTSSPYDGY